MRQAAGGDDHHVRVLGLHSLGLRPGIVADGDAEFLALRQPPGDDAYHFPAPGALRRQADLSARLARGFENHDLMAPFAGDAGGFEPGGSSADDHHLALRVRLGNDVRHGEFAAGRGIVDAIGAPP